MARGVRGRSVALAWLVLLSLGCASTGPSPAEGDVARASAFPELAPLPPSGEGMWPWRDLGDLDEGALRARGLQVPLSELWSADRGGLLGAVAGLPGCTASFVSAEGLLLTNHHCAHGLLARNSTPGRNVLADGFVAPSRADELTAPGSVVYVFLRQSDVTEQVLARLPPGLDDEGLARALARVETELVAACERQPDVRCAVSRENDGLRFALLENLELRDVRVVAAPPESLGSFGGAVDNWRWPRHTLDFALLRAYVGPDGRPAPPSPANVPYRPARFLAVAPVAPAPGDLVMVAGKPGRTRRYESARALAEARDWLHPARAGLFEAWLGALERGAGLRPEGRLAIASWVNGIENGLLNARGMVEGLARNRTVERAREREVAWRNWVLAERERAVRWGGALDALEAFEAGEVVGRERDLWLSYWPRAAQLFGVARALTKWAREGQKPDGEREPGFQLRDRVDLEAAFRRLTRSFDARADQEVMALFTARLCGLPDAEGLPTLRRLLGGRCDEGTVRERVTAWAEGTLLDDEAARLAWLDADLSTLGGAGDPLLDLALALAPELDAYDARERARVGARFRLARPWLASLLAFSGARFYPDANNTPRVSFAHVAGYAPRDGQWHSPATTLAGLAAKVTGQAPFEAPSAVQEAIAARRHGPWADPRRGDVIVAMLSNADTTGGNSGSPVLDGRGRLVGLNFDRVYENIAGDYGYAPERSRNIWVATPAILWYLDVVAGAGHLLTEMGVPYGR
jgi:hypothetical protein